jgi:hypothetical protein
MDFTHAQISELLLEIANSENVTNLLMQMTLETFMKSERSLHQQENPPATESFRVVLEQTGKTSQ